MEKRWCFVEYYMQFKTKTSIKRDVGQHFKIVLGTCFFLKKGNGHLRLKTQKGLIRLAYPAMQEWHVLRKSVSLRYGEYIKIREILSTLCSL